MEGDGGRRMGKKDAGATKIPVDQYRKQIAESHYAAIFTPELSSSCWCPMLTTLGKQDYKKTKSVLKATRLKAEAKKNSSGFRVRLPQQTSLSPPV
ncbi:hypothetical protein AMECASPLE_021902 [Ameca splendens]|uniref:Triple QxxK/R motif-containing protein n=1 Tax=Ameca splendens TaxID=208324 RepID=A0ABV0XSQ4_9TELE